MNPIKLIKKKKYKHTRINPETGKFQVITSELPLIPGWSFVKIVKK